MKGHALNRLRLKSGLDPNAGPTAPEALVQILTTLARDVERFEELVVVQRRTLEQVGAGRIDLSDADLTHEARRLTAEAEKVAVSAHRALEEMRRLSPAGAADQVEVERA